ncbi:hypothetical protein EPUS_07342 [Endocarpon pusillum Z07020]|uniref:Uncharacterized protein n=1 Tax=Endocarpon pusillum (strain Z07020 / HMAS-L-300199) TaxID=1263415 RepID=U1GFG3_ENDPU|nr:uncharacterized protein EPUS_07342 [Endocarpon pusillum Z07020]ERF70486.1 hypothetical protein EPUS_07342 [Endocarpon pusillum Z07020]
MSTSAPSSSSSDPKLSYEISVSAQKSGYPYGKPPRNSFAELSSTPSILASTCSCGCNRKNTVTDSEYGCRRQPKNVYLFKHRKAEQQEGTVWPTLKDVLFTLIMSAGIVMVIGEILEILASIYLTQQLGFFSSLEFWRRWKVCMRLSVLALWLGKLAFDAGIALGKADAQRKPGRPLGTSFLSSL